MWNSDEAEDEEEEFDSYLFEMKEALKFINIMLYEDVELEYDKSIPEDELDGDDYELIYEEENVVAFSKLQANVANYEEILEEEWRQHYT